MNFVFFEFPGGYLKRYFREFLFCMLAGIFEFLGLLVCSWSIGSQRYSLSPYVCHLSQSTAILPPPLKAPLSWGVSQNYVGSMLLVSQLELPSRSYCASIREQKRRIRKNHINFLKTPWMAGCPWDTRPVSRQKCPFMSVFL